MGSSLENRPGDLPIYVTNNSKITEFSGWTPEISVSSLLQEVNEWFIRDEASLKAILA
jgi:CDP-paratose 2-epimerase